MHKYIDESKLRIFDKDITMDDVQKDIERYHITGFHPADKDERDIYHPKYLVADALYADYTQKRANYEAYIEEGMTARMLMTLRLSSLFDFEDDVNIKFWRDHNNIDTPEEAIALRIEYGRWHLHPQYSNFEWQNMYGLRVMWGHKSKDILTDYEPCFIDRKYSTTKSRIQLRDEWIAASAHLPPIVDGIMQWKRVWPEEFYKYRFGVVDAEEGGRKQIESSGE